MIEVGDAMQQSKRLRGVHLRKQLTRFALQIYNVAHNGISFFSLLMLSLVIS